MKNTSEIHLAFTESTEGSLVIHVPELRIKSLLEYMQV